MIHLIDTAHAATDPTATFASVIDPVIANILDPLIMLMFAVAVVVFVWGVVEMFIHGDDAAARQKGQWHMLGGIVGIFIMVSAWGIIYFISNTISHR